MKSKIAFVFVIAYFVFSETNFAQCPTPVVCSSGSNGDIVNIKLGGRGGTKTTAVFSYDYGIKLNAFGSTPNLLFQSNSSTKMAILSNGNVGIGCTTPGVKLAVNGKIQATEIEVKAGPCSDYVFEDDYELMKLSDLEQYVKKEKHLPEVPSAKEFKENGSNLVEVDDLLLRKVEELTLYIIEQDKKTEKLIEKVNLLEIENKALKEKVKKIEVKD